MWACAEPDCRLRFYPATQSSEAYLTSRWREMTDERERELAAAWAKAEDRVKELEAQIEALRRETIDKCAEISSEHECLSYHELCNCRGAITDAILAMKETGE